MISKYRKKPVVIEAVQLTDDIKKNKEVAKWCGGISWAYGSKAIEIKTLEGTMKAQVGDYIIKGIKGEFYPCKPDIFAATYEKMED